MTETNKKNPQKMAISEVFTFKPSNAPVRVQVINEEPWFCGKDVCESLGVRNHTDSLGRLDEDEKRGSTIPTPGGNQTLMFVSESGLYNLIFQSRKPEAKAFRKWVTSEVLPALRRTGSYGVGPAKVLQKYGVQGVVYDGRVLYPYADIVRALGGSARGGTTSRRNKYPQHFCKLYGRNFITQQYVEQLARYYKSRTSQLALDFELEPDRLVHLLTLAHRIKDERLRLELVQELTRGGVQ